MAKLLIQLFVPVVGESYDMFVPEEVTVKELTQILVNGVSVLNNGKYHSTGCELLSTINPERLLDPEREFSEYSIPNGSELMLL